MWSSGDAISVSVNLYGLSVLKNDGTAWTCGSGAIRGDGNNTDAKDGFESALSSKLTDALDAKKIEIAQSLYNQEVEVEEEEDEVIQSEE